VHCNLIKWHIEKCIWKESGVYGGNIKVIVIAETDKMSVSVYFVLEDQIT
jgi:hypothetical protein